MPKLETKTTKKKTALHWSRNSWWVVGFIVCLLVIQQLLRSPINRIEFTKSVEWKRRNTSAYYKALIGEVSTSDPPTSEPVSISIPLNQNSSYVNSDISKILHIPSESRIEIHLRPTRRCQNPTVLGRISGWSLSMIQFEENITENVLSGTYNRFHMPVSGKYPLEIIVILCEKYPDDPSFNLLSVCVEHESGDTTHITSRENAFLEIQTANFGNSSLKGRWLHESLISENTPQNHSQALSVPPEPILTPFQPKGCNSRKFKEKRGPYCNSLSIDRQNRFREYRYVWNSDRKELNQPGRLVDLQETSKRTVCFMGWSHTRVLMKSCGQLKPNTPDVECKWYKEKFPESVTNATATALKLETMSCTHVVVGLFQWPFSFQHPGKTVTFEEWKENMRRLVNLLTENTSCKILLRSAHSNGLGERYNKCPPSDVRTPINAGIATRILKEIAHEFDNNTVTVLDTSFLLDPVWDSATDWCHYSGEMATNEFKYILSEINKESRN